MLYLCVSEFACLIVYSKNRVHRENLWHYASFFAYLFALFWCIGATVANLLISLGFLLPLGWLNSVQIGAQKCLFAN